ncbi:ubiquitin carboxy-terminal hydrolase (macronuclear) [Tetrahymena thermophila SB210]|uniref:Ubiquitin carboxy-terminal hydrolase n=1 Tax=Tetrahymena thermophila (strain SB210) TaxID=312017 RepID=I7LV56_TETTS|nr:ubiquitin carboxy-terminal hydrolase [Tetrahymena thermophila SB210]EAR97254.2 ubiquitin carboxy-terminal hydrolase [Tetrahymena thermophila SB210]|eukprot:XP_001017499.2 ubiquitin carboxy-terminal hydrolase [Tetrahymena thermophila SB210]
MLFLKSQKKPFFTKKTLANQQSQSQNTQNQINNNPQNKVDENFKIYNENDYINQIKLQNDKFKTLNPLEIQGSSHKEICQQNLNIDIQRKKNPQKLLQPIQTLDPQRSIERASLHSNSIAATSSRNDQTFLYQNGKKFRGGQKLQKLNDINFNDKEFTPWEQKNTVDLLDVCQEEDILTNFHGQHLDKEFKIGYNKNHHHNFYLKSLKLNNQIDEDKIIKKTNNRESYQTTVLNQNRNRLNDSQDSNSNSTGSNSNLLNFSNQLKSVATYKQLINNTNSQESSKMENYLSTSQLNNIDIQDIQNKNDIIKYGRIQNITPKGQKGRCKSVVKERTDKSSLNNNSFANNYHYHNLTINTDNVQIENPGINTLFSNPFQKNNEYEQQCTNFDMQDISTRLQTFDESNSRCIKSRKNKHLKTLSINSQNFSEQAYIKDSISSYQMLKQSSLGRSHTPKTNQNKRLSNNSRNITLNGDTPISLRPIYTPVGTSGARGERGLQDRGNTSFMNSVLQVFRYLEIYSQEILNYETQEGGNPPFIFFLKSIFKDLSENREPVKYTQFINFIYTSSNQFKKNETGDVDNFIEYLIQETLTTLIKFQQNNSNQSITCSKNHSSSQQQALNKSSSYLQTEYENMKIDQSTNFLQKHSINILSRPKQSRMGNFISNQTQETQIDTLDNDNFEIFQQSDYCLFESSEFGMKKLKGSQKEGQLQNLGNLINATINFDVKLSLEDKKVKVFLPCLPEFREIDKQIIDIYNKFVQSIEHSNILNLSQLFFGVSKVTYCCLNCQRLDEQLNDINLFKIIKIYDDSEYSLGERVVQTGFFQYHVCKTCKIETKFIQKLVYYTLPKYFFISIQKQSNFKLQFCSNGIKPPSSSSSLPNKKQGKCLCDTQNFQIETIYKSQVQYSLKGQILNQQGSSKFSTLIQPQNQAKEEPMINLFSDQYFKQRNKFANENVKIMIYERIDN